MTICGITDIQTKPSIIKDMEVGKIVDKRANKTIGFFISSKYENMIKPIIKKIDKEKKIAKLKILKKHQDLDFAEIGVDDGI